MTSSIVNNTYVDVTTHSKDILGRSTEKTTRLNLPIVWTVNKKPSIINKENVFLALFGPSGIILYLIGYKIFGAGVFIVYSWFGVYMLRSKWNLYKIGPGIITLDSEGFNDSRLGPHQIPWSIIQKQVAVKDSKGVKPFAIILVSDDARAVNSMITQYRRANLLPVKSKKAVFKLPIREVENRQEIAQAVQIFMHASHSN